MTSPFQKSLAGVCLLLATTAIIWANQPAPVKVTVESRLVRRGSCYLHLTNLTHETQTLEFSSGPRGTASFATQRISLSPGMIADLAIGQLDVANGIQTLHVISTQMLGRSTPIAGPSLYEIFVADTTGITKTTYEAAFLSQRRPIEAGRSVPLPTDIGGGYLDAQPISSLAFDPMPMNPDATVQVVDEVTTFELAAMRRKEMPVFGGAESSDAMPPLSLAPAVVHAPLPGAASNVASSDHGRPENSPFGTMKGKFNLKVVDYSYGADVYRAAWGWKVRAWQKISGDWYQRGSTFIKGDGTWSLNLDSNTVPGAQVQVEFQAANRFVQLQDIDGVVHTWGLKVNLTGTSTNVGSWFADLTKAGQGPGMDDLYRGANALWRKFHKYGMNANLDEPVQMTYPNTKDTGECQDIDGGVWTCTPDWSGGKIYVAAKHAEQGVAQHELAHTIQAYYWGSIEAPINYGQAFGICTDNSLALTEGFGVFMAYWVQFDRSAVDPSEASYGYPIDTISNGSAGSYFQCSGQTGPTYVAATLWDAYDLNVDHGYNYLYKDSWHFSHVGAVVGIFLNNGSHDAMPEFIDVYTKILGPSWAKAVRDIFVINGTDLVY